MDPVVGYVVTAPPTPPVRGKVPIRLVAGDGVLTVNVPLNSV